MSAEAPEGACSLMANGEFKRPQTRILRVWGKNSIPGGTSMGQTLLLFEIKKEKHQGLQSICGKLGIRMIAVQPKDYGQKLGYLAGVKGFAAERAVYTKGAFPMEMIAFSGMDSERLDVFLNAYKESGMEPVALKAILTPHNVFWTAEKLFSELFREHLQFAAHK